MGLPSKKSPPRAAEIRRIKAARARRLGRPISVPETVEELDRLHFYSKFDNDRYLYTAKSDEVRKAIKERNPATGLSYEEPIYDAAGEVIAFQDPYLFDLPQTNLLLKHKSLEQAHDYEPLRKLYQSAIDRFGAENVIEIVSLKMPTWYDHEEPTEEDDL